ncbi:hypothetical protein M8A51_25320 [Schlegelella sp. S2-27]|uniref:Uncharacterized protein n=1 Tax=Caldimonas mangrovi TaxID=2944811 RepID=A0ABT0YWP5_9BURK|nr:hypothetical protein [Caldimonas mangrovi]MCM5682859.1 hypothetical protein [Caldimonas mangrovi]
MNASRRIWVVAAVLGAGCPSVFAQPGLPQRNLRIELRQGDQTELARQGASASGSVVISSHRTVNAQGGVTVHTTRRESVTRGDGTQQVLVLNGGRAGIRLAQQQPLQWYQVIWNARDGATLVPSKVMLEAGRGFTVQPRWPGGGEPVTVEIAAESSRFNDPTSGMQDRPLREGGTTLTRVQVPLGEWVTIADTLEEQHTIERGNWSSAEARGSRRSVVQMRVTAP